MIKDAVVRVVRLKEKAGKGKRAGMTMIEVLIVVAVLAVIGAAVMPRFNTYIENSRYATAESDLDAIMTAVSATYSQVGSFGTVSGGDLDSAFSNDFADVLETMFGRPIEDLTDPWGNAYQIITDGFDEASAAGTLKVRCDLAGNARENPNNKDRAMERIIFSFDTSNSN